MTYSGMAHVCARRYAADSTQKDFVPKLRCAYCEILGKARDWSSVERRGTAASAPVSTYLAFTMAEQRKLGNDTVVCPEYARSDSGQ